MSFLGTYADLNGCRIGNFTVECLVGRDRAGAPCWRVVCGNCRYTQVLSHARAANLVQGKATQNDLLCANNACPLSRHTRQVDTIADYRRRERRQAEQDARAAAEAQRAAEAKAGRDRAQAARLLELQRQYIQFVNHQWKAGAEEAKICTRQRWFELTDGTRQMVLDRISKDSTVRFEGL